jgi:hypothetical protein
MLCILSLTGSAATKAKQTQQGIPLDDISDDEEDQEEDSVE